MTFEQYLVSLVKPLSWRVHEAAVAMELLPAWLRFLESRGLIDGGIRQKVFNDFKPLSAKLLAAIGTSAGDPAIARNLGHWGEAPADAPGGNAESPKPSPSSGP